MHYFGYTYDGEGIRIWPFKKYKYLWKYLTIIYTEAGIYDNSRGYRTILEFSDGKKLKLQWRPILTYSYLRLVRYVKVLELILATCSEDVFVSDKTRYLVKRARYIKALKRVKKAVIRHGSGVNQLMVLAHAYWVRLELGKAKKTFKSVIDLDRRNIEALVSLARIELERGNGLDGAIEHLKSAQMYAPENPEVMSLLAVLFLVQDKREGVALAKSAMLADPENTDVPQHLADYFARQHNYTKALEVLTSVQASEASAEIAPFMQKKIDFIKRLSTDRGFQLRDELKRKFLKTLGWALSIIALLLMLYQLVVCFIRLWLSFEV